MEITNLTKIAFVLVSRAEFSVGNAYVLKSAGDNFATRIPRFWSKMRIT